MIKYLITICLMLAAATSAQSASAQRFWGNFSGSAVRIAADVNDDGIQAFRANLGGKGRFGPFSADTVSETTGVDGSCGPTAVTLTFTTWSTITRYLGGDLLYFALDDSQPSTLCFDFVSGYITSEVHSVITGGTGRFAGATGAITLKSGGDSLLNDSFGDGVHSSVFGEFKGNIFLNRD